MAATALGCLQAPAQVEILTANGDSARTNSNLVEAKRDSLFTDRPSFAADPAKGGVAVTHFGMFDTNPAPGQALIPRNYGQGPSFLGLNLRLARTFGFGLEERKKASKELQG